MVGCLVTAVGTDVLGRFLPAFVALGFLIPVPAMIRQEISIPLQTATASVTQAVLETFGQVGFVERDQCTLAAQMFEQFR